MAFNAAEAFNSALSLFSSLYQDMNPTDLPEGLSPDNRNVWFLPGSVSTRPAFNKVFSSPPSFTNRIMSIADFPTPSGDFLTVFLDSAGNLNQSDVDTGTNATIDIVTAGTQFKAVTAFDKQWVAFFGQQASSLFSENPFVGVDVPRYYDGQNVSRVTQDAPGASPLFANLATSPIPLAVSAVSGSLTITAAHGEVVQTVGDLTYFTRILYTASAPVPTDWLGQQVSVSGLTGTNASLANITATVAFVSGSTFNVVVNYQGLPTKVNLTGESGTAATAGNYLVRQGNIVTAFIGAVQPTILVPGLFVKVINSDASPIPQTLGTIEAIVRDAFGIVTVTINEQLTNLAAGTQISLTGITDSTNFPASTQKVLAVVSATGGTTIFTISWSGTAASSSSGTVIQTWSGTFQLLTVGDDPTNGWYVTYFQLGPDSAISSTGGTPQIQIQSQVPPGIRNAVLMFQSIDGAITAPSIPVQISVVGGTSLLQAQDVAIGPPGTAARIIAFTPALGSEYFYLKSALVPSIDGLPPVLSVGTIINDNVTTSAIFDFSDVQLEDGIDIGPDTAPGNNLFNQIVLAPCLGVAEYQSRLFWWGEINNIKNFLNMSFDGGYVPAQISNLAGSGTNTGSGVSWSNPGNIGSSVSYADVSLTPTAVSKTLVTAGYGFSVSGVLSQVTVTFNYYWTNLVINPATAVQIQLLQAGVPVGSPMTLFLEGVAHGTSASPLNASFTFPPGTLLASDVNNSTFGVQLTVTCGGDSTDFFVNGLTLSPTLISQIPPGWSSVGSTGGTPGLIFSVLPDLGFQYSMTSAGGTNDCMISQSAYQDYYGAPIVQPNLSYIYRCRSLCTVTQTSGNLVADLFSTNVGIIAQAVIPFASLPNIMSGWIQAEFSAPLGLTIPSDTLLRVYLQNVPIGGAVQLDELEMIDAQQPVLYNQMRASYPNNPFGYDEETGLVGADTSESFVGAFVQRGYLYINTDDSLFLTQNNGTTEPDGWPVSQVAQNCGASSPCAVDVGAGVAMWAGRYGHQLFTGDTPKKISQELQPTWDTINWAVQTSMWLVHDPVQRIVYMGLPTGTATAPNIIYAMSYRSVDSVYNVPDPLHISYSGKLICSDLCRKSTIWDVEANCGAMVTRNIGQGNAKQMLFGSGNGQNTGSAFGNLYFLNFNKFTDDDYGVIDSYYTTYFHWNHDMEQNVPQLGLHRKIYTYLSAFITGVGNLQITPLVDSLSNAWAPTSTVWDSVNLIWATSSIPNPLPPYQLSTSLTHDLEWPLNVVGDRVAFKVSVSPLPGQTDAYFNLQHIVVAGRMDNVFPVRGAII